MSAAERIDAVLPQTQCTRCGYSGCRPYADALAEGSADINRCPPGGDEVIARLAVMLGVPAKPLDPECGTMEPARIAWIDPQECIGCAKCLAPCPVDAIIGAQKFLHSVIPEQCTGCELCIAPCPVDCIQMRPADRSYVNDAEANRSRYHAHLERAYVREQARASELAAQKEQLRASGFTAR